ncbi:hypothetical protein TTHERM_000079456 (macronuclear) [Tetrahymena thermophila SB210]|uniref:Uncharacterized protein n=1 Tax=Tetrahymena thermophila (strain SB210) TaxID=312017 RepID=W7XIA2_TETTS|nr:hypothetical protein TTHERM_000079456 [Tetrahymena thermophila SB210]EWS74456.1 hypothetical protein TTHERM_000079456 [Tetrahymena thermophila SB210]|eukprot:XP_012653033.1 hypothetical protein TTHERM_000079456 [Tetrahymena thermophila SB210]
MHSIILLTAIIYKNFYYYLNQRHTYILVYQLRIKQSTFFFNVNIQVDKNEEQTSFISYFFLFSEFLGLLLFILQRPLEIAYSQQKFIQRGYFCHESMSTAC